MLTLADFDEIETPILYIYNLFADWVISDIAKRLMRMMGQSASAAWQVQRLIESGKVYEDVLDRVAQMTGMAENEIHKSFIKFGVKSVRFDNRILEAAGKLPADFNISPAMLQLLEASARRTMGLLRNLTGTTANASQQAFLDAADLAYMEVAHGAMSYDQAVKAAVKHLVANGVRVIHYPSGHQDHVDVAARRAVLTGVAQAAGDVQMKNLLDLDVDLIAVSAHIGARNKGDLPENHEMWQGRVYSITGAPGYNDFIEWTGYGTGEGLSGWNCRHSFYPYFEGMSQNPYTETILKDYASRTVRYNGKTYSFYDATQIQRRIEREIRANKRVAKALEDVGIDNWAEMDAVRAKQAEMRDFIKQTGLIRQPAREGGRVSQIGHRPAAPPPPPEPRQPGPMEQWLNRPSTVDDFDQFMKREFPRLGRISELRRQREKAGPQRRKILEDLDRAALKKERAAVQRKLNELEAEKPEPLPLAEWDKLSVEEQQKRIDEAKERQRQKDMLEKVKQELELERIKQEKEDLERQKAQAAADKERREREANKGWKTWEKEAEQEAKKALGEWPKTMTREEIEEWIQPYLFDIGIPVYTPEGMKWLETYLPGFEPPPPPPPEPYEIDSPISGEHTSNPVDWIPDPNINPKSPSMGGIFESYNVEIDGIPGKWICKPKNSKWNGLTSENEVLCYEFTRMCGWDLVPPTFWRDAGTYPAYDGPPKPVGASMQEWMEDTDVWMFVDDWVREEVDERNFSQMVLLDYLTGNTDRHQKNFLVDLNDYWIWAIDNGAAWQRPANRPYDWPDYWEQITGYAGEPLKFNREDIERLYEVVNSQKWKDLFMNFYPYSTYEIMQKKAQILMDLIDVLENDGIGGFDGRFKV